MQSKLNHFAEKESIVDLQDLFFRFTLDGFAKIGFNVLYACIDDQITLSCMQQEEQVPFATAFDRAQNVVDYRFFNPF